MNKIGLISGIVVLAFFWGGFVFYSNLWWNKVNKPLKVERPNIIAYPSKPPTLLINKADTYEENANNKVVNKNKYTPIDPNYLFNIVNNYRISIGKQAWIQKDDICSIAQSRANELSIYTQEYGKLDKHQGFIKYQTQDVYYSEITVMTPQGSQDALDLWLSSAGHKAVLDSNFIYGCAAAYENVASFVVTNYDNNNHL